MEDCYGIPRTTLKELRNPFGGIVERRVWCGLCTLMTMCLASPQEMRGHVKIPVYQLGHLNVPIVECDGNVSC